MKEFQCHFKLPVSIIRTLFKSSMRASYHMNQHRVASTMTGLALFLTVFAGSLAVVSWPLPAAYAQDLEKEEETIELVEFAANIEIIKGHLAQAVANKQVGQNELAIAHAGHPVIEVYYLIEEKLAQYDAQLNVNLKDSLTRLANEINDATAEAVQTHVAQINTMLDQTKSMVIDENEINDPEFNALVIISLLQTAEIEYQEAISEGKIVEMIEYQDCTAFIARAEALSDSIKVQLPEREGDKISELYGYLNSLVAANTPFEKVRLTMRAIGNDYAQLFQFEEVEPVADGKKVIDDVIALLDQSIAEYKDGNPEKARAIVLDAYLGYYEYVELDIAQDDRELMLKIEIDMHETLVQMIEAGRPASEIEGHVNTIKSDLETAKAMVVPEFPAAILAIAAIMAAVIAIGRFKRTSLFNQ